MTTVGGRLLKAASEARDAATCEHELREITHNAIPENHRKWWCQKCGAMFWEEITNV